MALVDVLARKRKLSVEDIALVVNMKSQRDYLLLNYMEQEIIRQHGEQFLTRSGDKISYMLGYILNNDINGLFEMYDGCLTIYMDSCNNDINLINSFNITFLVLVNLTMKVIRKNKNDSEE